MNFISIRKSMGLSCSPVILFLPNVQESAQPQSFGRSFHPLVWMWGSNFSFILQRSSSPPFLELSDLAQHLRFAFANLVNICWFLQVRSTSPRPLIQPSRLVSLQRQCWSSQRESNNLSLIFLSILAFQVLSFPFWNWEQYLYFQEFS